MAGACECDEGFTGAGCDEYVESAWPTILGVAVGILVVTFTSLAIFFIIRQITMLNVVSFICYKMLKRTLIFFFWKKYRSENIPSIDIKDIYG